MPKRILHWLGHRIVDWLNKEEEPVHTNLCDMERLRYEIRPGDVILAEGNSHVSDVIKVVSQSPWTHSALYIGKLYDIEDAGVRECIQYFYDGDPEEQLIIEALLGQGTIVAPINKYSDAHLRICRPRGLSPGDAQMVIAHAIRQLGSEYDVRQLLDLARFVFPYAIVPRRWRSSLFSHNAGQQTRTVCSSLIAEAFSSVNYPILPLLAKREDGSTRLIQRNPLLFTPKDFDYSPYFDIIKYPCLALDDQAAYRRLPWADDSIVHNDGNITAISQPTVETEPPVTEPVTAADPNKPAIKPSRWAAFSLPRH